MTVSTDSNKIQFNGDDSTVNFPFAFPILEDTDLVVIHRDASDVPTTWVLNTDFTVSAGPWPSGGTVTATTAPATGETLTIKRVMTLTQLLDYITGGKFPSDSHEEGLDRLVMIAQQIDEILSRAVLLPETTSLSDVPLPDPVAEYFLRWNSAGNALENQQLLTQGVLTVSAFMQTVLDDVTASDALTTLGFSAFIKTLIDDADAETARETLGAISNVINWTSPVPLGSSFSVTGVTSAVATALNGTDIAFTDFGTEQLKTYRFNGTTWAILGSALSVTGIGARALATLNSTDVAYIDSANNELRTYRFNGSTWSLVGSGLAVTGVGAPPALTALNSTDVAFIDSANDELRTYRFNGSTWSLVGSGLSVAGATEYMIEALNGTDVAFLESNTQELRTYRFNGSIWSQVGSSLAITGSGWPALTALNDTDVVLFFSTTQKLQTYRFNGSTWSKVGNDFTLNLSTNPFIVALNGTDIAAINSGADTLAAYRFGFYLGNSPHNP